MNVVIVAAIQTRGQLVVSGSSAKLTPASPPMTYKLWVTMRALLHAHTHASDTRLNQEFYQDSFLLFFF